MMQFIYNHRWYWVVVSVLGVCLGKGVRYLFWDSSLRILLWDQNVMKPLVTASGGTWSSYLKALHFYGIVPLVDGICVAILFLGFICLLVYALTSRSFLLPRWLKTILWACTAVVFFQSVLTAKAHNYSLIYLIEYSLQYACFLLLLFARLPYPSTRIYTTAKVLVAATFTGHGLIALNYLPRPALFYEMPMKILGIDETQAGILLTIAGILDILASAALFIRWRPAFLAGIIYCLAWGTATTLARITAGYNPLFMDTWVKQWWPETIMRLPHAFIPPFLLAMAWAKPGFQK